MERKINSHNINGKEPDLASPGEEETEDVKSDEKSEEVKDEDKNVEKE